MWGSPEHDYILALSVCVLLWNWSPADTECHLLIHQPVFLVAPRDLQGWPLLEADRAGQASSLCSESRRRWIEVSTGVLETGG